MGRTVILSFLISGFSRIYMLIERRRRTLRGDGNEPAPFEYDTNYPFF
jgi:hypothetical protein